MGMAKSGVKSKHFLTEVSLSSLETSLTWKQTEIEKNSERTFELKKSFLKRVCFPVPMLNSLPYGPYLPIEWKFLQKNTTTVSARNVPGTRIWGSLKKKKISHAN